MTTLHSRTGFLRSKVFLALAGVFLVFVAARAALLWWEYDRTLAAEQRRAENLAHVLAEHLDRTFGALESAVNQLAVRSDRIGGLRAPREEWSAVLAATLSGLSGIGSLNLLNAEGRVVLSTNPAVTGTSRRGRYLHRRLKDERSSRLVIGPAAPAEHIGGVRIPIGRALHDAEGNFAGFIAATFQPERLRSFYEAIDVGPHGVIRLFHADGNLLFSQPHAARAQQETAGNATILRASRDGAGRGFLRAPFGAGSDSYFTAWRVLTGSALVVTVSVAERDAFSAWYTELLTVSGSAGGMALLLGLAGAWITTSGRVHAETAAERDRAGAALRRGRAQFQAIIDHSPSGIVLRDRDGRHLVANRKVQEWYGLPAEAILGRTVSELFGEQAGREAAEQDRRVAATGDVLTREVETTFPDGAVRRIATTEFPVRFADDDTVFVGGILTDVTGAREADEKLRQSQKMEAIGQLTGGVAHDFNNMLTAIMGNLEFLRDLVATDRDALGYLDTALRAAVRSSELTHRLLAFSRRQPMAPVSTDVNRLLADCRVLLQRTLGAEIGIETYMSANAWPALVDPSQLENALLNLAINARDAMPGGGKLTIESANMTFDDTHAARNPEVAPGPHVMISVSDTGTGIAPEALRHVFEPFYTTKAQGEGTGLGLSMVYGFAKQSGGHVSIYSELGHGTTVRLFLPRAPGAGRAADAPEAPSGEILTGDETILVVEDDEDVAEFVAVALESLGYTVVPASDGPSALRCLRERGRVDLLLTDVVLPNGMNGREIAARAGEIVPDIRTVFMSGYAESIIVHQGRLEEGLDFLPKPFARDALARKIRASLDSRPARPAG